MNHVLAFVITVELGSTYKYKKCGSRRILVEHKDTYQYVPLIVNLQHVLQNQEIFMEVRLGAWTVRRGYCVIFSQVSESHVRCDNLLGDVCDSSFFKDHPLFGVDPLALHILMRLKCATHSDMLEVFIN